VPEIAAKKALIATGGGGSAINTAAAGGATARRSTRWSAVVDGGRGESAMVVDKSVLPKVARRGRQRRTAAQSMAAAAGWPVSLLAVTWIKILLWRYKYNDSLFYQSFLSRQTKNWLSKKFVD
jgi:hypothetical protein